jgi:hypothetical protein
MYHSFPARFLTRLLGAVTIALTSTLASATLPLDEARIANQRLYMLQFNEANDPSLNCLAIQIGNKTLVTYAHVVSITTDHHKPAQITTKQD